MGIFKTVHQTVNTEIINESRILTSCKRVHDSARQAASRFVNRSLDEIYYRGFLLYLKLWNVR